MLFISVNSFSILMVAYYFFTISLFIFDIKIRISNFQYVTYPCQLLLLTSALYIWVCLNPVYVGMVLFPS